MSLIPKHVALIMDGNRRWARSHRLLELAGHRHGEERIEPIVDEAIKIGIPYLTFWAFSTENWQRSKKEVNFLLNLYRNNLNKKVDSFHRKNVKLNIIGNISMFPPDITEKTKTWMEKTKNNTGITVNIALSYGGRDEILRAIYKLRENSKLKTQNAKVTMEDFSNFLDTAGQPDPDLLIRTGGEQRLSGFLLWQMEYTELYFTETLWPDFTPEKFREALEEYQKRCRRYGK
jgi:undecaprenyl diphosphate synthase